MSYTFVASDFIQSFNVFSQLSFKNVRSHLQILSLLVILLSVQKPSWNAMSFWVTDDVRNTVALSLSQLTGSESGINSQNLANQESESSSHSLYLIESIWNGSFTIDVCIENTMNVLKSVISVLDDQRH